MPGSVLEQFFIMFGSNADQVRQGLTQTEAQAAQVQGTLNAADSAGVLLGEHLTAAFKGVAVAAAAFFSLDAIKELVTGTAEVNAQLNVTSKRLGVSVEDLDAWQRATQRAGGSAEGFTATLDFLNRGLAGLNTPGGTSRLKPFLEELHIPLKSITGPIALLETLADKSKELGAVKFAGIAERFGIDPGTQLLLANGRRELVEMIARQKELGTVTTEQAEAAHKYEQALDDLKTRFHLVSTSIGGDVLPALSALADGVGKFITFLEAHKNVVTGFFIGVAGVVGTVFYPAMAKAVLVTLEFLAEWLLIPALILAVGVAFALAYDDVIAFLDGNKSVIGELSKKWPELGNTVKGVAKGMREDWDSTVDNFRTGRDVIVSGLNLLGTWWDKNSKDSRKSMEEQNAEWARTYPRWTAWVKELNGWLDTLQKTIAKIWHGDDPLDPLAKQYGVKVESWSSFFERAAKAFNTATVSLGGKPAALIGPAPLNPVAVTPINANVVTQLEHAGLVLHSVDKSPFNSLGAAGAAGQRVVNYKFDVGNITIETPSADPREHARIVKDHLENELRQTIGHFDDGVKG